MPNRSLSMSPVAIQILLSLAETPRHGYGIKVDIEERTGGEIALGSGTLYQGLQRLENQGLIAEHPEPPDDDRRGRSYTLTAAGRSALDRELRLMHRTLATDYAHDLLGADRSAR